MDQAITTVFSGTDGTFVFPATVGTHTIKAVPPNPLWSSCEQEITIEAADLDMDTAASVSLVAERLASCPFLEVELSAGFLRRCFQNQLVLQYCNNGNQDAENAVLTVDLDPYMEDISTSWPDFEQVDDQLIFDLGTLLPGDCGIITIVFHPFLRRRTGRDALPYGYP